MFEEVFKRSLAACHTAQSVMKSLQQEKPRTSLWDQSFKAKHRHGQTATEARELAANPSQVIAKARLEDIFKPFE